MKLNILNELPKKFLDTKCSGMHELLGGPTLIHLLGKIQEPLFVSALLHGNETTSILALQKVLKKYQDRELPRDFIIFIGNTEAAVKAMRHLPGQPDYNRIWAGGESPEHSIAREVKKYAMQRHPLASIDIHNNTGNNPLYGCVNKLAFENLALASFFGDHTVYFTEPHNVQSMAFSNFCPAITVEAGLPGELKGVEASVSLIDRALNLKTFDGTEGVERLEIYHTIARIKLSEDIEIDFEGHLQENIDVSFLPGIDEHNFEFISKGTKLGFAHSLDKIKVEGNNGDDLTSDFFYINDGKIITQRVFIPAMFSKDIYVVKGDCLGYVMEKTVALSVKK